MTGEQPRPEAGGPVDSVTGYIRDLRALKVTAGQPSLQELQRRSGVARSTLSDALNPNRRELPRLEVCLALVRACGVTPPEAASWRARWQRIAQARDESRSLPSAEAAASARGTAPAPASAGTGTVARTGVAGGAGDPGTATSASAAPETPAEPSRRPGRRYLPPAPADFTARDEESAAILAAALEPAGQAPVVVALDGMAGVGKTALALHVAHGLADRFPDGQFYLDLHAHTPGQSAVRPLAALDTLLRADGCDPAAVPSGLEERAARWRAELADRRTLLLVDNAADAEQVRPLLPGTAGHLVLVTSRRRLLGLEGAVSLSLAPFHMPDATTLFRRIVGPRADAEPEAVAEVVGLCGRLPLAVRIAAARLRHRPAWTVAVLAERLRAERGRLDELASGHLDVSAAFQASFDHLEPDEREAFALLGVHPGADIGVAAASALLDRSAGPTEDCLEELLDANLLEQRRVGRYTFHDLLRVHSAAHAARLPQDRRTDALRRVLDHYLSRSSLAMDALYPHERYRRPEIKVPPAEHPGFPDRETALGWLDLERANLVAVSAQQVTAEHGLPQRVIDLSAVLARYLERGAHGAEGLVLHERALRLAESLGDPLAEAAALRHLALTYLQLRSYAPALDHLTRSLEVLRAAPGDHGSQMASTLTNLGAVSGRTGELAAALRYFDEALTLSRAVGDEATAAIAANNLGLIHRRLGNFATALEHHRGALELDVRLNNAAGQSICHDNLGVVLRLLGRLDEALDHHRRALLLDREANDRVGEAISTDNLGLVLLEMGDHAGAREHFEAALVLGRELDDLASEGIALGNLGTVLRTEGRPAEALPFHEEALALFRTSDEQLNLAEALNNLGQTRCSLGDPGSAPGLHEEALALARSCGDPVETARSQELLGNALHALGDEAGAVAAHRAALDAYRRMGLPRADALAEHACGEPVRT
ncbi:tetratricopeptide repeat protein [Streptacidiphilus neutrinimicus]|uniref:tetratricopeptide repeat protein n=1 Tax=Streptacidiphilus neutrinimicus TaxID=105420 RepID=UPI00126A0BB9|nr:tetratricopeptide repeat protein [Streptacidiphilus neutrinimicus]